ncbi:MAG: hypothetical protein AB1758_01430 [Candidatus Eremiobacterota bacterium]
MRRCFRGRAEWGSSLIEMLLCCALMGLLMVCIQRMMAAAVRYYQNSNATTEIQQNTLVGMAALSTEMVEGNRGSFRVDSNPPLTGLIFGSPRGADGKVRYEGTKLLWQKLVCYYVEEVNGVKCLVRREQPSGPTTFPPLISNAEDCESFQAQPGLPRKIVARNISRLDSTQSFPIPITIEGEITVSYTFKVEVTTKISMKN